MHCAPTQQATTLYHPLARVLRYAGRRFGCLIAKRRRQDDADKADALRVEDANLLSIMILLQNAPQDAIALVKESLGIKSRLASVESAREQGQGSRNFYGARSCLFPGIPRGPTFNPIHLTSWLQRQLQQARSRSRRRSSLEVAALPQPLSLEGLQLSVDTIVQPRIDKCRGLIIDPFLRLQV